LEVLVADLPASRPAIIHAEAWPSLISIVESAGRVKDETQVIRLAKRFRDEDRAGTLRHLFAVAQASEAVREEGWILGVTA
jgi:hypothetical protein